MKTTEELGKEIHKKALELADGVDMSGVSAQTLFSTLWKTFEDVDRIQAQIFDPAVEKAKDPAVSGNPQLVKAVLNGAWMGVEVATYILGIRYAVIREVDARSRKNNTNLNFGLLKMGHDLGDMELQKKAMGHLRAILLSIPYKKGWFHPPEGREGWIGVIDQALAEQLKKFMKLDAASTLQQMAENGFANVYEDVEARLIDEIRTLGRRPREVRVPDVGSAFGSVPVPGATPENKLQRLTVIKLARDLSGRFPRGSANCQILQQVGELLEDTGRIQDLDPRKIRALVVQGVAEGRGVCERQARKDVVRFEELAETDPIIRRLADEIRAIVPPRTGKMTLKLGDLKGRRENGPEEAADEPVAEDGPEEGESAKEELPEA
jgi:hypothetical protein